MNDKRHLPQGVDALTGRPWPTDLDSRELAVRLTAGQPGTRSAQEIERVEYRHDSQSRSLTRIHLGPSYGVDPSRVGEAGWAVLWAEKNDPSIREALEPLLSLRRAQAGPLYREITVPRGESKLQFLSRQGAGPGPANPQRLPYYLLIVADPEDIPFSFQRHLDVQYAVGRVHFDSVEAYTRYAASVVAAETGKICRSHQAAFFSPRHPDDPASHLLSEEVVEPLVSYLGSSLPDWQTLTLQGEGATKARLVDLLRRKKSPAIFFAASHGLVFSADQPRQEALQGSLLCQDWPGPRLWNKSISEDFVLSGDDVDHGSEVDGMIAFLLSSFSVGTTKFDVYGPGSERRQLGQRAFVSSLAQSLLARGALAVWGTTGQGWHLTSELQAGRRAALESAIRSLADGQTVGFALEYLDQLFAEIGTEFFSEQESIRFGAEPNETRLKSLWLSYIELQNSILLGDPAVRLPLD